MFRLSLLLTALVCGVASSARAQDSVGTRALSLAEAYRANATGNDAISLNPAGIGVVPRYAPEFHYQYDLVREENQFELSLVDARTSRLAVGLAYTYGSAFTRRAAIQHQGTLALSYPLLAQLLRVGASLKYLNVSDAILGNYLNAASVDLAMLSRLPFGLSVAAVGTNLWKVESARAPLGAGFAANLNLGPLSALLFGGAPNFGPRPDAGGIPVPRPYGEVDGPLSDVTVEVDWALEFSALYGPRSRVSGGVEMLLLRSLPLRVGGLWREADRSRSVSVGAGFIVPTFGLDVGYLQNLDDLTTRVFSTSIKLFL